ncbi:MAG: tRNA adenosine(34) deaminase TadA [Methylomonas sp.]|nr:tRNA adenosine(34) deaminase TadA [Methylomonas sp.]PPD22374.1 MAG: tRNA adenosine(34) deaminase TadA [Methylomonas sp.]PPD26878.1 MAG: tRNA adenosine(34) deaminase TadA [Methylomonas sp.]PPD37667.1 MAG: tRNA adenosine(34) deaminase TadA [Methylomonas sp.]PPD38786.1 MAG: tRNA adenosine(34) deaminase TadA [Methylomonas sp.]
MDADFSEQDAAWMRHAIRLAQRAEQQGEVPVGAVLVQGERCLAEGWNQPIQTHDPSAHAEIVALRRAGAMVGNYRLIDSTLYVTLEPCVMCMGALAHARVKRLVFGAFDPKRGAVCHALQLSDAPFLNHRITWTGGVLESACATLLTDFFKSRR